MRLAYLDCFAGISGDMLLGALLGAGVPFAVLEDAAAAMNVGATLRQTTVDRSGISAVKVEVLVGERLADEAPNTAQQGEREPLQRAPGTQNLHREGHGSAGLEAGEDAEAGQRQDADRSLSMILRMIEGSRLRPEVTQLATRTFALLGGAEAKIHNVDVEEIHFHEVGAVDAIVDIVAACAGVVHLGVDAWHCSPVNVGGGTVRCAHGVFPVPAPATAELLRGVPTYSAHVRKELVTPTGAALLRMLAPSFGEQPAMSVSEVGYGAGTRNPEGFANVLRLSVGESASGTETQIPFGNDNEDGESVAVLETALDDASPQLLGYVADKVLAAGALDVMLTPVVMKKGRPGTLVTVLCPPGEQPRFEQMLLRETTTLGVRSRLDRRVCLAREHVTVKTEYGAVRIKVGNLGDEVLNAHPEFEDCREAARRHGVALKTVMQAATAAWMRRGER